MRLLRRIITAREEVMDNYKMIGDSKRYGRHAHFIGVMEEVESVLRNSLFGDCGDDDDKDRFNKLVNHLATLQSSDDPRQGIEEPDIDLPEAPRPGGIGARLKPKRTFVPETTEDDALFAILAFFDDFSSVEAYIVETWNAYLDEEIDLITASVTTNTALELLRGPHEDLVKNVFPAFYPSYEDKDMAKVISLVCIVVNAGQTESPQFQLPRYDKLGPEAHTLKSLYSKFLIPNLQILSGMSDVIKDGYMPLYRPGFLGTFDPTFGLDQEAGTDEVALDFQTQWQNSKVLLCETFLEYMMLLTSGRKMAKKPNQQGVDTVGFEGDNAFFFDEMAVEMDQFVKTKQPTLLLLMHSQVFIDVNIAMQGTTGRANQEMRKGVTEMLDSLRRRSLYESEIPPSTWPTENEEITGYFQTELERWLTVDPIRVIKKHVHGAVGDTPSAFFDRSPILCGLMLFKFRLKYQDLALTLVNAWGTILSTAHLYLACQLQDKMPGFRLKSWPDMDLLVNLHGKAEICGGRVPETLEDVHLAFLSMMGYTVERRDASLNATTEMPPRLTDANHAPKGLEYQTVILQMFEAKLQGHKQVSTRLDISLIQSLLKTIKLQAMSNGDTIKLRRERRHRSPKFSTVQLLAVIEAGLRQDATALRFDYISMHLRCIQSLKKVRAASHEYLSRKIGKLYIENESQLPFVVGYILQWATVSGKIAVSLGIKNEGSKEVGSKLLLGSAKALNELPEREGNVEVKRVKKVKF